MQGKLPFSAAKMEKMLTNMEMGGHRFHVGPPEKPYLQLHEYPAEPEARKFFPENDSDLQKPSEIAQDSTLDNVTEKSRPSADPNRNRASTLENRRSKKCLDTRKRSVSEGETNHKQDAGVITCRRDENSRSKRKDAIIMIDNSNIFIGAREAACATNPKLKPKHVKVRLQALAQVLEKDRNVTKRFAGGSSPPANEHVWDIYRYV